jgi:hypothetical protein
VSDKGRDRGVAAIPAILQSQPYQLLAAGPLMI